MFVLEDPEKVLGGELMVVEVEDVPDGVQRSTWPSHRSLARVTLRHDPLGRALQDSTDSTDCITRQLRRHHTS
jgi:hypothetical protein